MNPSPEPPKGKVEDELPAGYRGGIITAITLFISFSLLFVKYWSLEAVGDWTLPSALAETIILCAIFLEIITLWRAIQVRDSLLVEYKKTLRWFMASIIVMIIGLLFTVFAANIPAR